MSVSLKAGGGVSKKVKVERPRPLKIGGGTQPELGVEDLLVVVDNVRRSLLVPGGTENNFDLLHQLQILSANLKISGGSLERSHKDVMDKLNTALMSACRQEQFSLVSRLHMLELLELRSMKWQQSENVANYYKQKLAQISPEKRPGHSQTAPVLNTGPLNLDPFRTSFQERERELPSKHEIQPADLEVEKKSKMLVSASSALFTPSPSPGEVQDKESKQFSASVKIRNEEIIISGASMDLVNTAKVVLNEFFNICSPAEAEEGTPSEVPVEPVNPSITYKKEELLEMSRSPLCLRTPDTWDTIAKSLPGVVRRPERPGPTSKLILREMEGLRRQEEAKNV